MATERLRYVALGDSYTIGTSVRPAERWPDQLVELLGPIPPTLTLVANLGVNGYTSGDLIVRELPQLDRHAPEFATVLIGTNDAVQEVPEARFRANMASILEALRSRLPSNRLLTIGSPDYTLTPQGAVYGDPIAKRALLLRNNAILAELATGHGIRHVDVWDLSQEAASDASLLADDGLHPSGRQYTRWSERILPEVRALIGIR